MQRRRKSATRLETPLRRDREDGLEERLEILCRTHLDRGPHDLVGVVEHIVGHVGWSPE